MLCSVFKAASRIRDAESSGLVFTAALRIRDADSLAVLSVLELSHISKVIQAGQTRVLGVVK